MNQRTLFPSEPSPILYPGEPPVWLMRLVLLCSEDAIETPIRDIEFRLGLNIVTVAEDHSKEAVAFGHNVGKTLLVRLIRFCLGDPQYATANMRGRIRYVLPDAWVIGVVRVRGETWSVARSLGHGRRSWCVQSDDWRRIFRDPTARHPYTGFQQELERLVPTEFAQVHLSGLDRCPVWADLLGWLMRDQACRYTHHNEWRNAEADSGVATLSLGNANLITRLTMGLFDVEEDRFTTQLETLRTDSRTCEAEIARLRLLAELMRESLVAAAPLSEEVPDGQLFTEAIRTQIRQRLESQERLLEDPDIRRGLNQAEQHLVDRRTLYDRTAGRLEQLVLRRELVCGQLAAVRQPAEGEALARDRALMSCQMEGCLYLRPQSVALPDPMREQRIRDYTLEIEQLDRDISSARSDLDQHEQGVREATTRRDEARRLYDRTTAGIRQAIARYDAAAEELTRYEASQARLAMAENRLRMSRDRERETERQRETRATSRDRAMAELNDVFEEVTTALLRQASGELVLNLRDGLAPRTEGSSGEAFGTTGKVIGFDLTCLLAGMLGQGRHPRFLVHDSPREADMHWVIYENLFRFVRALEDRFPGERPAFQYIITTTTQPPTEVARRPYVRETLHAMAVEGRLLRAEF